MNRNEYFEFHSACCENMVETTRRKNHDYAGAGGDNPFHNFEQVERMGICSTEVGFLTRMTDKISRIQSFVDQGVCKVKDESIEDTLIDLANYSILMAGYIKSKKDKEMLKTITIEKQVPDTNSVKVGAVVTFRNGQTGTITSYDDASEGTDDLCYPIAIETDNDNQRDEDYTVSLRLDHHSESDYDIVSIVETPTEQTEETSDEQANS